MTDLRPINARTGEVNDIPLDEDLADVLIRMTIGWKDIIGHDLNQHPDVVRVLARFRARGENDRGSVPDPSEPPTPAGDRPTGKCSHGGCQTDAVVVINELEPVHGAFDYAPGETRYGCRYHMAVLCEPGPLEIGSYFLVEPA